jgi:hypothetical protein
MDNRFNIPVLPVRRLSNGATQEARLATGWKWWSKPVGGSGWQIRQGNPERRKDANSAEKADQLMPCCQEIASSEPGR